MTTLICWVGRDQRKVTSIYFASDSRISWGSQSRWESGRKLFFCRKSADLFGYCGEVLFPTQILPTVAELLDLGVLHTGSNSAADRHHAMVEYIRKSHSDGKNIPRHDVTILHASRDGENMACAFSLWCTQYDAKAKKWIDQTVDLDVDTSQLVAAEGSGANALERSMREVQLLPQARTSRSYFWGLCDALKSGADPFSGGSPQMAMMYSSGPPSFSGVIFDGERYIWGRRVDADAPVSHLEWRDELFHRTDPITLMPLKGARRHGRDRRRN